MVVILLRKIVMNERKYLENIRKCGNFGKDIGYVISLLAILYRNEGYCIKEIKEKLWCDLKTYNPLISVNQCKYYISKGLKNAGKREFVEINEIPVTKREMDVIMNITSDNGAPETKNLRRLAFTLLCFAKFGVAKEKDCNSWVNYSLRRIYSAAKLTNSSEKKNNFRLHELRDKGLLHLIPCRDGVRIKVNFVDENQESDIIIRVKDINYTGDYFFQYCGKKYVECKHCGKPIPKTNKNRNLLYCRECAIVVNREQTRNRMAELRNNQTVK